MSFLGEVLYRFTKSILLCEFNEFNESNNSPLVYGCLAVYPQLRGHLHVL